MKPKAESVLAGKRIRVHVLGCRSNLYEAEAISSALSQKGAVPCEGGAFDGAIVVSCVVTAEAERKCRQLVRRLKREEPAAPVVVCGCWAQLLDEKKAREMGINAIVGNRRKHRVAAVVEKLFEERVPPVLFTDRADISASPSWDNLLLESARFHVRAFVKVQDGCDHHCTYCIIPSVRGASVSRNPREVLSEIRNGINTHRFVQKWAFGDTRLFRRFLYDFSPSLSFYLPFLWIYADYASLTNEGDYLFGSAFGSHAQGTFKGVRL